MSDITASGGSHALYAGIAVDIAEDSLDRVTKLLAGINGGAKKAVGSALARAAAAGKTAVKRPITQDYAISQSEFLAQTKNINHFTQDGDGGLSVVFGFAGHVIPLMKFNTRVDSSGRVTTQVKRSSAGAVLEHAFKSQVGSHTGIFERDGAERFPIRELFGPATPQMMYSDENVTDTVETTMAETYEKRIEHEIDRLLNGWGR